MRRKIALFVIALALALPGVSRADFVFKISQSIGGLNGAGSPPAPFYLFFNVSSGDQGLHNNSATIYHLALSGANLVGGPLVQQGTVTGNVSTPNNQMVVHEGTFSTSGDSTNVYQRFAVTSNSAALSFDVLVSQNFAGVVGTDPPDQFNYGIYYSIDGLAAAPDFSNLAPVETGTLLGPPGNSVFALYDFVPGTSFRDVQTFGPSGPTGNNPFPVLNAIGPAIATPEPAGSILWAATLCGVGGYYLRRRKVQLAEAKV